MSHSNQNPFDSFDSIDKNNLYAVIDLGSNSFHLLVARSYAGRYQPIQRVRRKVRLANGLNEFGELTSDSIERGLSCLKIFADRITILPKANVKIVATATLRLAKNRDEFLAKAEQVLGCEIKLITGEEEAQFIYLGAITTSASLPKRIVFDIGGASTEVIVGNGEKIEYLTSLPLGCVTWRNKFFTHDQLNETEFGHAVLEAKKLFQSIEAEVKQVESSLDGRYEPSHEYSSALSACGTVQTVHEIMLAQRLGDEITLAVLYKIKSQLFTFSSISQIKLRGLYPDKIAVFPSGLAILIAIFEVLEVKTLNLAGGALREGVLASFQTSESPQNVQNQADSLCQQSITYLQNYFHIDKLQAKRVKTELQSYLAAIENQISIQSHEREFLLYFAELHELGLSIDLRQSHQHAAYIVQNFPLLGFSSAQKQLIATWLLNVYPIKLKKHSFTKQQLVESNKAFQLAVILRISMICCYLRSDTDVLKISLSFSNLDSNNKLLIKAKRSELESHPLIESLLLELIDDIKNELHIKLIKI